ncbi:cuticle protein 8 [Bombyx mandarina]|uniref:Cuticle protein 8 n=1 Tax=Bombyx mandarina TaxID=7092 RepID=A0A6J2KNZ1_BOMMA|nr:cuticle protein 8 [Bombyx mandarina]
MIAKIFFLCCACASVMAAPGLFDGYGYAAPAYAAPVAHAVAPAYAAPIAHAVAAPVVKTVAAVHAEPIDPNPAYSFSYGVQDPATGDHKDATETLQNGVVHGSYSLVEPDGHLRKVTYTADKINGFNAVVERTGGSHAVAAAPVAKVVAAPVAIQAAHIGHVAHPWG